MNSDCIEFCALKLSIKKLVRLIFLLKIPVFLIKKKKEGHKKEGVVGEAGFYLSKYVYYKIRLKLKIKKERGRDLSPFDGIAGTCLLVGANYINWNCIPIWKLCVVEPLPTLSPE